jgi:DNA-binding XRE family transcriptional regulator
VENGTRLKDFEVTVQIRNNRLKQRRLELGYATQREFAKVIGVSTSIYCALETLRDSPLRANGEWRDIAIKLVEFHGCGFEELFPSEVLAVRKNKGVFQVDAADMLPLLSGHQRRLTLPAEELLFEKEKVEWVRRAVGTLSLRERMVLKFRYGLGGENEHTLAEIGDIFGVLSERIRQVELAALRKLRHPIRSHPLRPFYEDSVLFEGVEES